MANSHVVTSSIGPDSLPTTRTSGMAASSVSETVVASVAAAVLDSVLESVVELMSFVL